METLEGIPVEAVAPVLTLVNAIARIVAAGSDAEARENAIMKAAEDLKAEIDRAKFG